jgi:hypothetical protein
MKVLIAAKNHSELMELINLIFPVGQEDIVVMKCVQGDDTYVDISTNVKFLAKELGLDIPSKVELPAAPVFNEIDGENEDDRDERFTAYEAEVKAYMESPAFLNEANRQSSARRLLMEHRDVVRATTPLYKITYAETIAGTTGYQPYENAPFIPHTKSTKLLLKIEETSVRQRKAFEAGTLAASGVEINGNAVMDSISNEKQRNLSEVHKARAAKFGNKSFAFKKKDDVVKEVEIIEEAEIVEN